MADNVGVRPSTTTGSVSVATDEINSVHYPIYKHGYGVDGSITLVSPTNPLPSVLYGSTGSPVNVDSSNHLSVIAHAHAEGGHAFLDADVAVSTDFILIDVSDTVNYPHENTGSVHSANMIFTVDATADADYTIDVGFIDNVDATDGDFHVVFAEHGTRKTGNNKDIAIAQNPEAPWFKASKFVGPVQLNQTSFASGASLRSTLDPTTANINPGNGDAIVRVTMNAGAITLGVSIGYHSHV